MVHASSDRPGTAPVDLRTTSVAQSGQLTNLASAPPSRILEIAVQRPDLVRKLLLASVTYNKDGFHPGLLAGLESMKPKTWPVPPSKRNTRGRPQTPSTGPG